MIIWRGAAQVVLDGQTALYHRLAFGKLAGQLLIIRNQFRISVLLEIAIRWLCRMLNVHVIALSGLYAKFTPSVNDMKS